jgi:hypothetical protein
MTNTTNIPNHGRASARKRSLLAAGCAAAIMAFGWLGIRIAPAPFTPIAAGAPPRQVALPPGLPAPVARFYRQRFGEQIPLIESAVISGRGTMRIAPLFNLTLPVRFRFVHDAGRAYRHYIEVTIFGLPLLKVNEYYVNGVERQELPWAVATGNPKLDQGGNLGMWAEILQWLPAALIVNDATRSPSGVNNTTGPQARWEAIDDESAFLVVPAASDRPGGVERFLVRFSPTGEIKYWEVMRYADGEGEKTLWINGTWFDDGRPWFVIHDQEIALNVPVDTAITTKGP